MEKVSLFLQKLHYNVYKFNCFTQIYVFGLPVTLLLRYKYIIKQYQKRGVENPDDLVKRTLINPQTSTVNWLSDGVMILLISMVVFSILNFVTAIAGYMIWSNWSFLIFLILVGIPSVLINYFALWKDDKYLTYYKEFEKELKQEKRKWAWISFGVVVIIILLLIVSFWVMSNSLQKKMSLQEKIEIILNEEEKRLYKGNNRAYDDKIEDRLEHMEDSLHREKNIKL